MIDMGVLVFGLLKTVTVINVCSENKCASTAVPKEKKASSAGELEVLIRKYICICKKTSHAFVVRDDYSTLCAYFEANKKKTLERSETVHLLGVGPKQTM